MFQVGDRVKWKSQAAGSQTEKIGVVVYLLGKDDVPYRVADSQFQNHRRMFDGWQIPGPANQEVGYLVEVRDGKTARATPKLYMPYPNKLVAAYDISGRIKKEKGSVNFSFVVPDGPIYPKLVIDTAERGMSAPPEFYE